MRYWFITETPPSTSKVDIVAPQRAQAKVQNIPHEVVAQVRAQYSWHTLHPRLGKRTKNKTSLPIVLLLDSLNIFQLPLAHAQASIALHSICAKVLARG